LLSGLAAVTDGFLRFLRFGAAVLSEAVALAPSSLSAFGGVSLGSTLLASMPVFLVALIEFSAVSCGPGRREEAIDTTFCNYEQPSSLAITQKSLVERDEEKWKPVFPPASCPRIAKSILPYRSYRFVAVPTQ
jgi:hypothetical protein